MKVDEWIKVFTPIIPTYNKERRVSLTWEQKTLMEEAYIELGGHPFCKTCPTEVADTLGRMILHTEARRKSLAENPRKPKLSPDTPKKDAEKAARELGIRMPRNISKGELIELVNSFIE